MARLEGKVAIVTGGGHGYRRGDRLAVRREGAGVVVADVDEVLGSGVAQRHRGARTARRRSCGSTCAARTTGAAWSPTRSAAYGKLNMLVNNAGISLGHDVEETTLEEWDHLMSVNATGVFLGMKHAIAAMKDCGERCSIVNRSSIDGQVAEAGLFAYCASKGAVTVMTKSAALAVGAKGYSIRVNSVHPGYVHTPLTEKEASDFGLSPDEYFAKVGAQHPIGFIGEPIDVAYLDVYLASDESRWVTGAEFTIDGGWTAQ